MVQERISGMDEKVVMKCHEQRNGKRCGREATAYIVNRMGNEKPVCSRHLKAYLTWGGYEFGPIGNLLHPPVKPCS